MSNICKHFLEGNCRYGNDCKNQHPASAFANRNNNNDDDNHREHQHHHRERREERPSTNQPHDYASVQTQMEIIQYGMTTIIDIEKIKNQDLLLKQLFKMTPATAAGAAQQQQQEKPNLILALDFHGVTDLVVSTEEEIFPQNVGPICVVSYVGPFGPIRDKTRQSIQQRIESKQVSMGIMVFKKLRDPGEKNIPEIEYIASKRHAVELLMKYNEGLTSSGRVLFVDDGKDNVATVASLNENRVKCMHFNQKSGDELRSFLMKESSQ